MNRIKPRTLSGFLELLPSEQVCFDLMLQKLSETFSLYGFTSLDTPLMEAAEVLLAKGGGETEKQTYLLKKGDTDLALRYELTASLAKYVALYYSKLNFPFRRFEIGKVYRGERKQRGRFREFYQADIDVIGDGFLDVLNDAEIPSVIYNCFTSMGLKKFVIHVNNRKVLSGLFEILDICSDTLHVMRALDKLGKIGKESLFDILVNELTLSESQANALIDFIAHDGDPMDTLKKYAGKSEIFDEGAGELELIATHLKSFGVPDTHFKIDLSIARGLDYYTGTVYETYMTDHPDVGSICSGGRYDNLAEHYIDRKLPGVGISIGLSRLFYILNEQKLLNNSILSSPCDVLIIPMTDDLSHAISLATYMRAAGLRVQIFYDNKKFKVKLAYADKIKAPYVVFLGEDELNKGVITVRDMITGEQTSASPGILTAGLCEKMSVLRKIVPIEQ